MSILSDLDSTIDALRIKLTCIKCKQLAREAHVWQNHAICKSCLRLRVQNQPCPQIDMMVKRLIEFDHNEDMLGKRKVKRVKFSYRLEEIKSKTETELHRAAYTDDNNTCAKLIKDGVNIECVDKEGWTPLHVACFRGNEKVVNSLIEAGADVNAIGGFDNGLETKDRPLDEAIKSGNPECTRIIQIAGGRTKEAIISNNEWILYIERSLELELRERLLEAASFFRLKITETFSSSVSHYICSSTFIAKRNLNYLKALLAKCAIVNAHWLLRSHELKCLMDENEFMIKGTHKCEDSGGPLKCTPLLSYSGR
ncbi:hypothetical protein ACOME3_007035 [Neoechinorhynchus agilis]